jgi:hypothetical protein
MGRTACTEPQCLYKGALYLFYLCTFIISLFVLLRIKNVLNKVVEKIKTYIMVNIFFFFENRTVYEIMWRNMVESGMPQAVIY